MVARSLAEKEGRPLLKPLTSKPRRRRQTTMSTSSNQTTNQDKGPSRQDILDTIQQLTERMNEMKKTNQDRARAGMSSQMKAIASKRP